MREDNEEPDMMHRRVQPQDVRWLNAAERRRAMKLLRACALIKLWQFI